MICVLLVDDQTIIRQGLANLLANQPDFQIVGDAANGQQAIDKVSTLYGTPNQADVILMDVRMPVVDGVAATKQICKAQTKFTALIPFRSFHRVGASTTQSSVNRA